jgi:hypothetical protein
MRQGERWGLVAMAAVGAVAIWQTVGLDMWNFSGPGPAMFPRAVGIAMIGLAVLCLVLPRRESGPSEDEGVADYFGAAPEDRRTFHHYLLALVAVVPAVAWAGFWLTAFGLIVFLMRVAEGKSLGSAVLTGAIVATVVVACFGGLLHVSLPAGPIDDLLLRLVRSGGL